jgi:hypothetical protein
MNKESAALEALFKECRTDYVGIWSILWNVRREFPEAPGEHRALTLRLAARLMEKGATIGEFVKDAAGKPRFAPWPGSSREALERIDAEWTALGRDPDIGDIACLTVTP